MENINLTENEKKELEKRGFYVKKNYDISFLAKIVIKFIISVILLSLFWFTVGWIFLLSITNILYLLLSILNLSTIINVLQNIMTLIYLVIYIIWIIIGVFTIMHDYMTSGVTFYFEKNTVVFGRIQHGNKTLFHGFRYIEKLYLNTIDICLNFLLRRRHNRTSDQKIHAPLLFFWITLIFTGFLSWLSSEEWGEIIDTLLKFVQPLFQYTIYMLSGIICIILLLEGTRNIYQYFHPLYAFWNIGMNIQKLTPEIESQSKFIQAGFQKDMNFSILHSGFEELSVIFSRIVELVLKLEKIEKRANKGNLFDSVKYIDSLRTDIINPLIELKVFLEKQRGVLLESQQELGRVMVWVSSELWGNVTLSSERGKILIQELDESIGKLDGMIGKMGQKP